MRTSGEKRLRSYGVILTPSNTCKNYANGLIQIVVGVVEKLLYEFRPLGFSIRSITNFQTNRSMWTELEQAHSLQMVITDRL